MSYTLPDPGNPEGFGGALSEAPRGIAFEAHSRRPLPPTRIAWECINVPPFPPIALRVLECVSDDGVSMCRLGDLISLDPALCSQVLTIANSPLVAHRFPVTSILQAVAMLGTFSLKGLCLAVAVRGYLGKSMNYPALQALWRHSLATASIAEHLVNMGLIDADDAHTAGILHEIGRFALSVLYPVAYSHLLGTHKGTDQSLLEIEDELFGFDHVEVGRRLLVDWSLPDQFREVIAHAQCAPQPGQPWSMGTLVHISCRMADAVGYPVFAGCEVTPFEQLLTLLPPRQKAFFHPDPADLANDLAQRIAAFESA
ncbi:MAG TPA: HDOD domain-containing protein [Terracidiphilus sp.]|jgi:HD-like signal output (HDOD) protein|nr:HDOD domain-containing protein [Terracidiphilus sp.]